MSRRKPIPWRPDAYRTSELIGAGVSRCRLGANDVQRLARGIVLHPDYELDPDELFDPDELYRAKCLAFGRALGAEHFLSHRSAAKAHRIPAPQPPDGRVDVSAFWPNRAPRRPEGVGHRVKTGVLRWVEVDGTTIPSIEDVWCQLASVIPLTDLVAAGDAVITGELVIGGGGRRRRPRSNLDRLAAAVDRHRGTRGERFRKDALGMLREPVDSPSETELRLLIVAAGFAEPQTACPVPVRGRTLYADLGYPDLKIAIEYDGAYHFGETARLGRLDTRRREAMRAAGWIVLVVVSTDLKYPREFLKRLDEAMVR